MLDLMAGGETAIASRTFRCQDRKVLAAIVEKAEIDKALE